MPDDTKQKTVTTSNENGREKRLKNLRPWKPGQTGNPMGVNRRPNVVVDSFQRIWLSPLPARFRIKLEGYFCQKLPRVFSFGDAYALMTISEGLDKNDREMAKLIKQLLDEVVTGFPQGFGSANGKSLLPPPVVHLHFDTPESPTETLDEGSANVINVEPSPNCDHSNGGNSGNDTRS